MPNDPDIPSRPPRRSLPLRYVLAVILGLFTTPVVVWLVWGWIEAARLDHALDALEARNEPLDLAAFDSKPTTPQQHEASHLYAEAGKQIDDRPITTQQAAALGRTIEELCAPGADPAAQTIQARVLLTFEERYRPVLDLLERASQLDAVGWDDADRPQRSSIQEMRPITLARANVVRIARLACTGEGDEAARALLATLHLRHVWVVGPIAMQTGHSLHALLTAGSASPALLQQIQTEYMSASDESAFEKWMLRERAFWLSLAMPGVFSDPPPGAGPQRITPLEGIVRRVVRPLRDHRLVEELQEFDEAIGVAKQPWPAKLDAVAAFGRSRPAGRSQSMRPGMIDLLTRPFGAHMASNALTGYIGGITETLARTRASVAAVAVARYQRDHAGALPATLQQLIPDYVSAPMIDPYTGAELKYRRDANGYKVYSVGVNRQDDGGMWPLRSDLQLNRRGDPLDIGIAVGPWPAHRP